MVVIDIAMTFNQENPHLMADWLREEEKNKHSILFFRFACIIYNNNIKLMINLWVILNDINRDN